jgi:regulator of PEP synthase PpsR (kinase-PPPase family)
VSDYSGETAEKVARAAMSQFAENQFKIVLAPGVTTKSELQKILQRAQKTPSAIFYTLVKPGLRDFLATRAGELGIPHFDVLGPALDALKSISEVAPRLEPGPLIRLDREYFKWIDAVQYAVRHDDGVDLAGLKEADLVLVGVSRTSKTPLSIYLAYRGWKVANVPIVYGFPPPKELFKLSSERVIGLTISPRQLTNLRGQRLQFMPPMVDARYAHPTYVKKEIRYSHDVMRKLKCHVINVTGKAVEEIAQEILGFLRGQGELL